MKEEAKVFHNDSLQMFNEILYSDILTLENLTGKKKALKIGDDKHYGFIFEKGMYRYFIDDLNDEEKSLLDILPIKIQKKIEIDYNKDVFWYAQEYSSVKIPNEQKLSFRELVYNLSNFSHTNPLHFTLYKILNIVAITDRINFRAISEKGFGKDSIINNLRDLIGGVANIYGATFAKMEYNLKYNYVVFNEMGNLKSEEKYNMQQFLLAVGAFFNKYSKRSRATTDTSEEYDISKLSLGIIYNPPEYYIEKGQEFFDMMFTEAVNNRFIPFYFTGVLNESFDSDFDIKEVVDKNMQLYKDIISTLLYYKNNDIENLYNMPDYISFSDDLKRFERSFYKIAAYVSHYVKDINEYNTLINELWNCYITYDKKAKEAKLLIRKD